MASLMKTHPHMIRVNKRGCWVWQGTKDKDGYGQVTLRKVFRKRGGKYDSWRVHRWAWTVKHGPIPKGMQICHHCDNPPCCNPRHLFMGTDKDNTHDMIKKGRKKTFPGELNQAVKLTEKQVREIIRRNDVMQKDLAKIYKVSRASICNIKKRKSWKHL